MGGPLDQPSAACPPSSRSDLEALAGEVTSCRACPRLVAWREEVAAHPRAAFAGQQYWGRPLAGFGDPAARIAIVGLAPAAHGGNRTGRIFTGDRSGDWLFAALWRAGLANQPSSTHLGDGLELSGAWVSAVVRCAPPGNRPLPAERDACLGFLRRELGLLGGLRVVVALGAFATDGVTRALRARRVRFSHGAEASLAAPQGRGEISLLSSYHPSQRNTFTKLLTEEMLDAVMERAKALAWPPGSARSGAGLG